MTIILAFLLVLAIADFARWWVRFFLDRLVDVLPVLKRRGFSGLQAAFWSVPSPSFSKALPGP